MFNKYNESHRIEEKNECGHCCEVWTVKASVYRNVTFNWRKAEKNGATRAFIQLDCLLVVIVLLKRCSLHFFVRSIYTILYVFYYSHYGFFSVTLHFFRCVYVVMLLCSVTVSFDATTIILQNLFFPPALLCYSFTLFIVSNRRCFCDTERFE